MRDALLWLGCEDPCTTVETAHKTDPAQQSFVAVLAHWHNVIGPASLTTRDVIAKACGFVHDYTAPSSLQRPNPIRYDHPEFRHALLDVAEDRGGQVSLGKLGKWLGNHKGRPATVMDGKDTACTVRIIPDTGTPGANIGRWRMQCRQEDGAWR